MSEHIGEAIWRGGLKDGQGRIQSESQALDAPYTYTSRFGEESGTNPEELLGAAHAACFSMALANLLEKEGYKPEEIKTQDHVTLEKKEGRFSITRIHVITEGKVPEIREVDFQKKAQEAKQVCPVSRALAGIEITLTAALRTERC